MSAVVGDVLAVDFLVDDPDVEDLTEVLRNIFVSLLGGVVFVV